MPAAARQWIETQLASQRVLKRLDGRAWTMVRYEDLCRRPRVTLARLARFADLPPFARKETGRSEELHILGNRMRLASTTEIKFNERWREELTADEIAEFDTIAVRWMQRLGYGARSAAEAVA
jgi:hypothetical protein